MRLSSPIRTNFDFEHEYREKIKSLLAREPIRRGAAHATKDETMASTHELMHITDVLRVDTHMSAWQEVVKPNLPWAEDHFQERISGEPFNPAPSEGWWPYARQGNAEHKKDEKFSHTYPERFWPKHAGEQENQFWDIESPTNRSHMGIRFGYGDLNDLLKVLHQNPFSRQAYLPVWFPEDLTAARQGERVPCSMGYHFIYNPKHAGLDCVYTMRSCDIVRFYRDDVYMVGRLLQWVSTAVGHVPGELVVHIDNLHCFPGDRPILEKFLPKIMSHEEDPRQRYRFEGLL